MNITDFEIAQASIELVGGLVCAMLSLVIMINAHRVASTRRMEHLLLITAGILVCDALCFIFRGNTNALSILIAQGGNLLVFILNLCLAYCAVLFIYSIVQERGCVVSDVYRRIVLCCSVLGGLIVLSNLLTGWMYYFDAENCYHRNFGWYVYTGLSMVSMVTSCVMLLHFRKKLSLPRLLSLLLFELCPIIAVAVQSFFYGLAITNMGVAISVVLLLLTHLVTWSHSTDSGFTPQLRHSYDTIILFIIMAVSISAAVVTNVLSVRRIANEISVSNSQLIAHVVGDQIEELLNAPITVARTMSSDRNLRAYMHQAEEDGAEAIQEQMVDYLSSIRTGFGYEMVFAVCSRDGAYFTDSGLVRRLDLQDPQSDRWYTNITESGKRLLLNVGTDEDNGWGLSVFVNAIVHGSDGSTLGVCGVALKMSELQALLTEFEEQYSIRVTLTEQTGLYEINSQSAVLGQTALPPEEESIDGKEFTRQSLSGITRLVRRMDSLGWYLTVEDPKPQKVNILRTIIPNILIFLVGLFSLLTAFCVILVRERKIARELSEKRKSSLYDELTGLKNRRALREDCTRLESKRAAGALAVVQMDLNGLKPINDSQGHQAGDELICAMASCLMEALGKAGELYRTGGDEFVAILTCDSEALETVLAEFDRHCAEWRGVLSSGISSARGVILSGDYPEASIAELIDLADQKMYEEKRRYYLQTDALRRTGRNPL